MSKKSREQLEHSRPLDVHKWSDYQEVNLFVSSIWDDYFSEKFDIGGRGRTPKQHPKYQLKVLLLDLYIAWKTDPDLLIGVGMSNTDYQANSRYNEIHISAVMIKLINHAVEQGLIERQIGNKSSGLRTRIWPTKRLINIFKKINFSGLYLSDYEDREVIILKSDSATEGDKKAKPVDYDDKDFPEIPVMRESLKLYNQLLNRTFIDIPTLQNPVIEKEYESKGKQKVRTISIDQTSKFVRRIFYRKNWEMGGRFHGGWWQQIHETWRKQIYIGNIATLEMDYSGLHVNLLYGLRNKQPVDDPYRLETLFDLEPDEQRKYVKSLVLKAINATSEKKAFQAFRDKQPTGSEAKRYKDKELRIILDAFKEKNPVISDDICTDQGVKLMNIDGKITSTLTDHFTTRNIPILSIHDSYIIQHPYSGDLAQMMDKAVAEQLGGFKVKIDRGTAIGIDEIRAFKNMDRANQQDYNSMYEHIPSYKKTEGYNKRLNLFKEHQEDHLR